MNQGHDDYSVSKKKKTQKWTENLQSSPGINFLVGKYWNDNYTAFTAHYQIYFPSSTYIAAHQAKYLYMFGLSLSLSR